MQPKAVNGWNVAELSGGLLLSADDFLVQLSTDQVDKLLDILNDTGEGEIRDVTGDRIKILSPKEDHIVLVRAGDKVYPSGIILPIDAFSELDDELSESIRPAFRRTGGKIKRGFRVTSGIRKGRVVANAATANKPRIKGSTRNKLRIAARKNKFIRAMKSKLTRRKSVSIRLRRMNHTD